MNPLSVNGVTVSALAAITAPQGNDQQEEHRYYHCTMPTASFHRPDGKKLPFIRGFFKTNIRQDIEYLENELQQGNQFLRRATAEEIESAKLMEDPLGTVREAVKEEMTLEELEKLVAKKKQLLAANPNAGVSDGTKLGGVDPSKARAALQANGVTNLSTGPSGHASATGANLAGLKNMVKSQ